MQHAMYINVGLPIVVGNPAFVEIAEHPEKPRGKFVRTSTVQSYDEATGVFVTRNTTYSPEGKQA